MINGCDLSHHNAVPPTFARWLFSCIRVSFGRGTDGLPEADERAELHAVKMRATNSACVGVAYHWANLGPAREQADLLVTREAIVGCGAWGLAIDAEDLPGHDPFPKAVYARRILEILDALAARDPRRPLLYASGAYLAAVFLEAPITMREIARRASLWLADWSAPYTIPQPWSNITILQNRGAKPGGIDSDVFAGTADELRVALGLAKGALPPALAHGLLGRGSIGPDVRLLQAKLNASGAALVVDGVFGPRTEAAVRAFQRRHELIESAYADDATWSALDAPASGG